ncbi:hypothetical protein BC830DRAFT_1163270 [Chytriomyces sp. MP71]|nr:hypothetical protein BC830DRAFT_1163270 [Chytriomyces sp. MP71]
MPPTARTWLTLLLAASMAVLAFPFCFEYRIYSLHPIGMAAYLFASGAAVLSLQRFHNADRTQSAKKAAVSLHALVQLASAVAINIGFAAIYVSREQKKKVHWKNIHSKLGLVAYILNLVLLILGIAMHYFPARSFGSLLTARKWLPAKRAIGHIAIALSIVAFVLGLQMHSTIERLSLYARVFVFMALLVSGIACFFNLVAGLRTSDQTEIDSKYEAVDLDG